MKTISDVSFSAPTFSDAIQVLTLQAGFNSALVVIGTTLLGLAAGTVGTFALLRGRALMADALAHSALPGLGIAFLIGSLSGIGGKHLWLLLTGAAISGILGVLCVQVLSRYTRLHEDSAIGAVLSCFFGLGVVLMSLIQSLGTGEEGGLHHFIYGQTAAMNQVDTWATLAVALFSLTVCTLFFKEFRLICFDEGFAASDGWSVSAIDLIMMSLVVIITVVGLQSVGLLLIIALLVIPPAGARFWTDSLSGVTGIAALIGGASGYIGSAASTLLPRLPAGAVIVLIAGLIFFVSMMFAPARGLLAQILSHIRMRCRVIEEHLLRDFYEICELSNVALRPGNGTLPLDDIRLCKDWSPLFREAVLRWLGGKGLIAVQRLDGQIYVSLTEQGIAQAREKVRNHRLWEEYLVSFAGMPVSHVDFSADFVEHWLTPEIVSKLELALEKKYGERNISHPPRSLHSIPKEE